VELLKVMTLEEVKNLMHKEFKCELNNENVSIFSAVNRICSSNVISKCNIPEFRRSSVDGYAVNSKDVFGASEAVPAIMELVGEIEMGSRPKGRLCNLGECFYIPTGGMLPEGADSVVMIEYSEKLDYNTILINATCAPGENVVQTGEDVRVNEIVVRKGDKLRPYEIGVLAGLGISEVEVYRKPRVGIISTGDEIIPCDCTPALGEIRDINTYLLWSEVLKDGGIPKNYGIIKDDFEELRDAVDRALEGCDIVLISGGSSVGKKDQTLKVICSYGKDSLLVHGIAVKPGKPTVVGKVRGKAVFGLPGHPLAASVIYKILVKDYMNMLMSHGEANYGVSAYMSMNYHKAKGREEFLPVSLEYKDGTLIASPVFGKSGIITAFSKAYGYVRIEKNIEGLLQGQKVDVYKL
jgi:molybdopterin molybdotransferase